jgi:signal transduction histidine kinase
MSLNRRFHSLLAQSILRIVLPLALVMLSLIVVGVLTYEQIVTALLVERDRQLAALSAASVSDVVQGYVRVLETLTANPDMHSDAAEVRLAALREAADVLAIFNAGVSLADEQGVILAAVPASVAALGSRVNEEAAFLAARDRSQAAFSDVQIDTRTGEKFIVVAVPIVKENGEFAGAVLGALSLQDSPLSEPINRLVVGEAGFAYLVDRQGRVIVHPQADNIGADYADRLAVQKVMAGESGGTVWEEPAGERVVHGYAPVAATGWGLILREPWAVIVAPIEASGVVGVIAALLVTVVATLLVWSGVRRITTPIQQLAAQADRLAADEQVEAIAVDGVTEIDALARAFNQMAARITAYRAGLRRYAHAITRSQEEERRRIARDLHDETTQSLLAISRRIELQQTSEIDPERLARLTALQQMVTETLHGVRRIGSDLRPLALEDLGLVPALRALIQAARTGEGAIPDARFRVTGEPVALDSEQELALYRITQEALTNIRKHAHASGVRVELIFDPVSVRLEIVDDGVGFELPSSLTEFAQLDSFGLIGVRERVWMLGGQLSVESTPGKGTRLSVTAPIHRPDARLIAR